MTTIKSLATVDPKNERALDVNTKPSGHSLFRQFTESTTLHGISRVFGNGSKIRRFIWLLCVLGCTAGLIVATVKLCSSYFSYDVVTRVTLINEDYAIFPAVTICNFNPLRKDYIEQMNLTEVLTLVPNVDNDKRIESLRRAKRVLNTPMDVVFKEGAHKMDKKNMLSECSFQRRQCGEEDFKPVFTSMGLCYTFNKGSSSLGRIQNSGEYSGLSLSLNVQQEAYYGSYSTIAGFKVHIHNKNEPPLVDENGFAVMPGTCTFVAVTKTKVISLPAPYKTKCENKKLPGITVYSKPLCHKVCLESYVAKKCGCQASNMPKIYNLPDCTAEQEFTCILAQYVEYIKLSEKNCSCPKPCEVTSYETRLSYAQYPSEHAKETLAKPWAKRYIKEFYEQNPSEAEEVMYHYMGKNAVQIRIFFQDLNYHVIEDIPKLGWENLLAGAGGMVGLLLGASLITVVEFLEFLFFFFVNKYLK